MTWAGVAVFLITTGSPLFSAQLKIQAVVNSASYQTGMPTGGALASIFVSGLTGAPGFTVAPSLALLPMQLAGITVTVNGATAPILAVAIPAEGQTGQINIQVPLERNATLQPDGSDEGGTLQVSQQFQTDVLTPLKPPSWGAFLMDANGYAIAQHASDYSLVTLQNPAQAGETIIAYAVDFFRVWPPPPIGFAVPLRPTFQLNGTTPAPYGLYLQDYPIPSVPICGGCVPSGSFTDTPALQISFQGLTPTLVGVEQINFVVPAKQQPGEPLPSVPLSVCFANRQFKSVCQTSSTIISSSDSQW